MRDLCGRAREHHFDVNKPECGQFNGHGGREDGLRSGRGRPLSLGEGLGFTLRAF